MTREILEKYIAHRDMRLYKGGAPSTQVFMPFLIMDCAYQLFSKAFSKNIGSYRHEQKKWLKFIERKFLHFFTEFNRPFTPDDLEIIGDDQDAFHAFITNELMYLKVAVTNCCRHFDFDTQMAVAEMQMVNILAACAGIFWEDTFHSKSLEKGDKNTDIDGVRCGTRNFTIVYIPKDIELSEKDVEAVNIARQALCTKITVFVNKHQQLN